MGLQLKSATMMVDSGIFVDREEAGRLLANELTRFKDQQPVVLALPRGGVPVAVEVADALHAPLDLILVRKIGSPWQPELAIAAVVDGDRPETVVNQEIVDQTVNIIKNDHVLLVLTSDDGHRYGNTILIKFDEETLSIDRPLDEACLGDARAMRRSCHSVST